MFKCNNTHDKLITIVFYKKSQTWSIIHCKTESNIDNNVHTIAIPQAWTQNTRIYITTRQITLNHKTIIFGFETIFSTFLRVTESELGPL